MGSRRDHTRPAGPAPGTAVAALEQRFDGPIPPRLLAAAVAGGAEPAARRGAAGEQQALARMAQDRRCAIARRRAGRTATAADSDGGLTALCHDLTRLRHLAVTRLSAAVQD